MKRIIIILLSMSLILLTGCAPKVFGVSQGHWRQMTPEQKQETMINYYKRLSLGEKAYKTHLEYSAVTRAHQKGKTVQFQDKTRSPWFRKRNNNSYTSIPTYHKPQIVDQPTPNNDQPTKKVLAPRYKMSKTATHKGPLPVGFHFKRMVSKVLPQMKKNKQIALDDQPYSAIPTIPKSVNLIAKKSTTHLDVVRVKTVANAKKKTNTKKVASLNKPSFLSWLTFNKNTQKENPNARSFVLQARPRTRTVVKHTKKIKPKHVASAKHSSVSHKTEKQLTLSMVAKKHFKKAFELQRKGALADATTTKAVAKKPGSTVHAVKKSKVKKITSVKQNKKVVNNKYHAFNLQTRPRHVLRYSHIPPSFPRSRAESSPRMDFKQTLAIN